MFSDFMLVNVKFYAMSRKISWEKAKEIYLKDPMLVLMYNRDHI